MPSTSRRTKRPQKRTQVTDDNGWTHVTSGGNVRRVMRSRPDSTNGAFTDPSFEPVLAPAEAPSRLTITELQTQYREHSEKWEGSETWVKLAGVLEKKLREKGSEQASSSPGSTSSRSEPAYGPVDAIVCIGLGSPSGFLRDGWTDRRSVSMYQLAALVSIKDMVTAQTEETSHSQIHPIKVYAQDPVFNHLDKTLLADLNIEVLTHPQAFTHITHNTLLFCPGAEKKHLELLLPSKPWLVFGGPLEHATADAGGALQTFVDVTGSYCLPEFGPLEHAFWNMRLYWLEDETVEEQKE
ncbi:hypothetical protein N7499_002161 [Penicillium canescens]|uniref:SRR1-like domain-containing protein n=1 Tax=Penicillium canescens TaxID=5083 RepID=A0AAD6N604_PENCN|nr:uncharacterized protein N7446_009702 [Penicillium canescens]KAJ6034945.1 hypothetical protein N7460_009120 [Penicillium canescens]KAJ6046607.1 hypothetical protein N7444_007861 [Penicillium canescens]KAJ6053690.1 hypothetical protein N7446_009702 [Penicillium canescens]KAJ6097787.1 hypothetical protein N7499_002161 [Penicillium canescens]KAJ6165776.1 hypothetical protein N7485_009020 [Penicillium canescens]